MKPVGILLLKNFWPQPYLVLISMQKLSAIHNASTKYIVFLEHFNRSDSELVSGLSRAHHYTQVEFSNFRSATLVN